MEVSPEPPVDGVWYHYIVPLTSEVGWIHGVGVNPLASLLAGVDRTRFRVYDADNESVSVSGQVDNFTLVTPEPGTFILFGLGAVGLVAWRRRKKS